MSHNFRLRPTIIVSALTAVATISILPQKSLAITRSATFSDSFPAGGGTTLTDFTNTLEVSKFDPNLGALTGISFTLNGLVDGRAGVENTSASNATIRTELEAKLTVTSDDLATASGGTLSQIVQDIPLVSNTTSVPAFDGILDFDGTSGFTLDSLNNTSSTTESVVFGDADFITFANVFTGTAGNPENIFLTLTGQATSNVNGPGTISSSLETNAGASFDITYTYEEIPSLESGSAAVPFGFSPTLGLLIMGSLFGTSSLLKKRKSQNIEL